MLLNPCSISITLVAMITPKAFIPLLKPSFISFSVGIGKGCTPTGCSPVSVFPYIGGGNKGGTGPTGNGGATASNPSHST